MSVIYDILFIIQSLMYIAILFYGIKALQTYMRRL